jgi:hypothetical protein
MQAEPDAYAGWRTWSMQTLSDRCTAEAPLQKSLFLRYVSRRRVRQSKSITHTTVRSVSTEYGEEALYVVLAGQAQLNLCGSENW